MLTKNWLTHLKPLRFSAILFFCGLLISLPALATSPDLDFPSDQAKVTHSEALMGTRVDFTVYSEDKVAAHAAIEAAVAEIQRLTHLVSEWVPDSEISKINRAAGKRAVVVSKEVYRLIDEAVKVSTITQGKFDITFAGAGKLWDFRQRIIPPPERVAAARQYIDYRQIALNPKNRSVLLQKEGMKVGLGGIAKGYAIDRSAQILTQHGFVDFAVNAGGDLYVSSGASQKPWRIGLQAPRDRQALLAILPVANVAIATSGDYERFFIQDGKRYHHILDPATGYPAEACQSVTIVAQRAYLADALATGIFVLGPHAGMPLIEALPDVEALIVGHDGAITLSSGLTAKLAKTHPGG